MWEDITFALFLLLFLSPLSSLHHLTLAKKPETLPPAQGRGQERTEASQSRPGGLGVFRVEVGYRFPSLSPWVRRESMSLCSEIRPNWNRVGAKERVGVNREFRKKNGAPVPEAHLSGALP